MKKFADPGLQVQLSVKLSLAGEQVCKRTCLAGAANQSKNTLPVVVLAPLLFISAAANKFTQDEYE